LTSATASECTTASASVPWQFQDQPEY